MSYSLICFSYRMQNKMKKSKNCLYSFLKVRDLLKKGEILPQLCKFKKKFIIPFIKPGRFSHFSESFTEKIKEDKSETDIHDYLKAYKGDASNKEGFLCYTIKSIGTSPKSFRKKPRNILRNSIPKLWNPLKIKMWIILKV